MKKKIIGIFICMLLIGTIIPVSESIKTSTINTTTLKIPKTSMAGNWTEIQKLIPSEPTGGYGATVILDGDTALIGAPTDDDNGINSGSVYVLFHTGSTWTQQAKLLPSDGARDDYFGCSVSLDGDTAIIGAKYDDDNGIESGSAYVFTRTGTTWTQQQKLLPSGSPFAYIFGYSVSLDGNTVLIGAIQYPFNGYIGAVYVFTRTGTTWTEKEIIGASDGAPYDGFGSVVSLDGNTFLVGANGHDHTALNSGSAFVFTRNDHNWTEQAELFASDGHEQDQFGESVSLSGDTALIGAPFDDVNGSDSGSAYVFTRTGNVWTQQAKLLPSDGAGMDYFGGSVSLDNDTAFIGSFHGNGSAYVFTRSGITWTQQQKLIASDGAIYDFFGQPVFLDGDTAFIAATGDDDYGSVYVFKKENHPPDQPTITGPAKGKVGAPTTYNFTTTDPDGDKVYYFIDWGDHTYSSWIGPYPSGELITVFHIWTKKGAYTIKAKAKDIYGNESDWGTLSVTMPTSYNISMLQFLDKLFERFPNAFPILRYLLGY